MGLSPNLTLNNSSFQPTRWSLICGAGSPVLAVRQAALERLCLQYWYPLYAYLRRNGRAPDTAADLVQGTFARLLSDDRIGAVSEGHGRFRNWLLTALQNHERDVRGREHAEKRGGGRPTIPIDAGEGERRFEIQGAATDDPVSAFERAWALETLAQARSLLEQELRQAGKERVFELLDACLTGDVEPHSRAHLAAELKMSAVAFRVTLHRLRTRYREILISVVSDSLGGPTEAGEELRALSHALSTERSGPKKVRNDGGQLP